MNDQQLISAKNLLNILPFLNYDRDDINGVAYNSFICNNAFVNDLFQYGLFDLPSNSKFHSWSFERILGLFIEYITKIPLTSIDGIYKYTENLPIDDEYNMVKIWFGQ